MSDKDGRKGYKDTLNLPQTSFAMKANLTQREPQQRKLWEKEDIYGKIMAARKEAPLYILHDGPPYANGDIHMGHVINKVLKDFVVKYKTMTGFCAPFVPGWDCHGLPIEVKVMAELGEKAKQMSKPEIRRECHKYASKYVKLQTKQFQSLGVFGDFEHPYLTLKPQYEQGILEIFAELVGNGLVYKQLKPIHWSVGCETALADAELEYKDITSSSIYVNFPMDAASAQKVRQMGLAPADSKVCFMIWTTTPWTLAANLAVALHPWHDYVGLTYNRNGTTFTSIVCADRLEAVIKAAGCPEGQYSVSQPVKGSAFEKLRYLHPYIEKNPTDKDAYFAINAEFVTTDDGTGIVHIAPGHGAEDYVAGMQYGLAVYSPVRDDGTYDDTVPQWLRGKKVLEVDTEVNAYLRQLGLLVHEDSILHSYPHCWRSKMPVILRATEQWFISVDKDVEKFGGKSLRNLALEQIKDVTWVPSWGQKRIQGMLESRPDWCISRQRAWGLPIPAFVNSRGQSLLTKESVLAVARHIGKKGSDSWFTDSPKEILGSDFVLPDGFDWDDLRKEENIFDVWFESGCSWHSVIRMAGQPVPVDLYLEGSDQHRGWFQLSLLPALGATGRPPFKTVLTHGFTVDEKGMKQSKSAGNYVSALEEIEKYGADVLRLWVASVNYQEDMRCSDELIGRLQEAYRKIRNTLRYLLSNINDFVPAEMAVDYKDMQVVDQWAMEKLQELIAQVHEAYESFMFHRVYGLIYNFCTVEMSSIYMDVLKDRMYCDGAASRSRRSGQTAMYRILDALVRMLAPILVHTAEEAWAAIPYKSQPVDSVHLALMPQPDASINPSANAGRWGKIMALRDDVLKVLEPLRKNQLIGSNQEAAVQIETNDEELLTILNQIGIETFAALCIVSQVSAAKGAALKITASKSPYPKCQRCWNYWPTVGQNADYPDLCDRCIKVTAGC
ncbi:MAG TPA: isoleucine--tRNA ligase [Anaerohalosphaeraceae bacterium]|nr:isoleucine--tRNA ligase [Anaerohalosphaeraceae bacterium]HPO69171.1 isoleucine--tRNA ligase [Anaerohalosphaeraceae bacterium]